MPTALTILALEKAERRRPNAAIRERIAMGRAFLLARICADGGWNYGTPRALGYDAVSYPETTGVALLALHGERSKKIDRALATAERHMAQCRSSQGWSWLAMGLLAHGKTPVAGHPLRCHNAMDAALLVLAGAAAEGKNVFLEDAL